MNLGKNLAVLLGSICVVLSAAAEEPPIRIGIVGPLSGPSSTDMGQSIVGGAKVFAHEVNSMGGLLGRKIELVIRDDRATPARGVEIAKELTSSAKVVATVGYANTGVAIPSSKVFQQAGVPLIVTVATGAKVTGQYAGPEVSKRFVFRMGASDAIQPKVLLKDLLDRRKLSRIAVLHDRTPYGEYGRDGVIAELTRRGMKAAAVEGFDVGDTDMTAQLGKVKAANAEAIILYGLPKEDAEVVKSAARMKLELPIVGSWTMSQQTFIENAGSAANGTRMAVTYIDNDLSSLKSEFAAAFRRINNMEHIPSAISAAQTYDALRLLFLAIFLSGDTNPETLRQQLEDLTLRTESTLITRYDRPFTADDHEAISENMVVLGEIRDGKIVYAYPEDANSAFITRLKERP